MYCADTSTWPHLFTYAAIYVLQKSVINFAQTKVDLLMLISQPKQSQSVIFVIVTTVLYTQSSDCIQSGKPHSYTIINDIGYIHWSLISRVVSTTNVLATHGPTWILSLKGKDSLPQKTREVSSAHTRRATGP